MTWPVGHVDLAGRTSMKKLGRKVKRGKIRKKIKVVVDVRQNSYDERPFFTIFFICSAVIIVLRLPFIYTSSPSSRHSHLVSATPWWRVALYSPLLPASIRSSSDTVREARESVHEDE